MEAFLTGLGRTKTTSPHHPKADDESKDRHLSLKSYGNGCLVCIDFFPISFRGTFCTLPPYSYCSVPSARVAASSALPSFPSTLRHKLHPALTRPRKGLEQPIK